MLRVLLANLLAVLEVGRDGVEEPGDGLLVVVVALALDNDLLQAVDLEEGSERGK